MRVFIAGATGVLGRRLVAECVDRGHDVVGLTRDDRGDDVVREAGGDPHRGDILDQATLVEAAADCDVLVHAATKIPTDMDPDEADWVRNDRVRREGAENLVATAGAVDADRVLMQSIVWVARQPDGSEFDEDAEPHPDRATRSALEAERIVTEGAGEHGYEPVVLRGGYFYAADAAHTRMMGDRLLARRLPIVGRGLLGRRDATLSFLHVDDAATAFAAAIEGDATGTYHVLDDEPVTYAHFLETLADRLDAPSPIRVPRWLVSVVLDDDVLRLVTTSMPSTNDRFTRDFDWEPTYATIDDGLDAVVERWVADGTIDRTDRGDEWTGE